MSDLRISINDALERFSGITREQLKKWIQRRKLSAEKRRVLTGKNAVEMSFIDPLELAALLSANVSRGQIQNEKHEGFDENGARGQNSQAVPAPVPAPQTSVDYAKNSNFTKVSDSVPAPSVPAPAVPALSPRRQTNVINSIKLESEKIASENPQPAPNPDDEKTKLSLEQFQPERRILPTVSALEAAKQMGWVAELVQRLETAPHGQGGTLIAEYAKQYGESERTVRRAVLRYREGGFVALARKPRADAGKFRIPTEILQLIVCVLITNPAASLGRVRRILELANTANIRYRTASGRLEILSTGTIAKIGAWLDSIPALRFARMDDKARKEFYRVWIGQVVAEHANQMWQLDMTRTDLMVWNPDNDSIFRTRVHAVIDVYSGAVPAFVFSQAEDQLTTNRTLMLALMEKPDPWRDAWNIWGKPSVLYWDNGKTYRSERVHQALEALGVNIVHSRARVSHTRGKIERFFGTLHNFCSTLPGYCGSNTTERDHDAISRLWAATRMWHAAGCPAQSDPYPERLLLEDEFKRLALLWLTRDYHQEIVANGKTREQLFLESAPAASRGRYSFGDLRTVFAKRSTRKIRGNGTVQYNGIAYGVADASFVAMQGMEIEVFEDDTMPEPVLEAQVPHRGFVRLEPLNIAANSERARQYRRDAKASLDELRELSKKVAAAFVNPELRYDRVLEQAKPITTYALPASTEMVLERDPQAAEREEMAAALLEAAEMGIRLDDDVTHLLDGAK